MLQTMTCQSREMFPVISSSSLILRLFVLSSVTRFSLYSNGSSSAMLSSKRIAMTFCIIEDRVQSWTNYMVSRFILLCHKTVYSQLCTTKVEIEISTGTLKQKYTKMSYSNNKPKSINCFLFLKNRLRNLMWKWSKVPIAKQKIMISENPSQLLSVLV